MATFLVSKVLGSMPATLEANECYFVRTGTGFDLYVTDDTGQVAYRTNLPTPGDIGAATAAQGAKADAAMPGNGGSLSSLGGNLPSGTYGYNNGTTDTPDGGGTYDGVMLQVRASGQMMQWAAAYTGGPLWWRSDDAGDGSAYGDWHQIVFADDLGTAAAKDVGYFAKASHTHDFNDIQHLYGGSGEQNYSRWCWDKDHPDSGFNYAISTAGQGYLRQDGSIIVRFANSGYAVDVPGDTRSDRLRLTATDDVSVTSTGHAFQIGPDGGGNLAMDGNEIMARSNGATSTLYIQNDGGETTFGDTVNTPRLSVSTSGEAGVELLSTQGGRNVRLIQSASGNVGVYDAGNSGYLFYINPSNDAWFVADMSVQSLTQRSDERLKEHIKPAEAARNLADQLEWRQWMWKKDGRPDTGVSAQAVRKVAPQHVHVHTEESGDEVLGINYAKLALEAVIGLSARVRELEQATDKS